MTTRRWGNFDIVSFPPLEESVVNLLAPVDFTEVTSFVRKLVRMGIIKEPRVINGAVKVPMTGKTLKAALEKTINDNNVFEVIIAEHGRQELSRHLSM